MDDLVEIGVDQLVDKTGMTSADFLFYLAIGLALCAVITHFLALRASAK